jgi:hypothetical protein
MDIPDDLREFLANPANRSFQLPGCQVREVTLYALDELAEGVFTVNTFDFALQERWDGWDTMDHKNYEFRGVGLVKACRNYSPKGIMVWFPELGQYGQWDCDHHKIMVFPEMEWADIMKNPAAFFDAMWNRKQVDHEFLRPWDDDPKEATI